MSKPQTNPVNKDPIANNPLAIAFKHYGHGFDAKAFGNIACVSKFFENEVRELKKQAIVAITKGEQLVNTNKFDEANSYFNQATTMLLKATRTRSPISHLLLANLYLYGINHTCALQLVEKHIKEAINKGETLNENEQDFYLLSQGCSIEKAAKNIERCQMEKKEFDEKEIILLKLSQNICLKLAGVHITCAIDNKETIFNNPQLMIFARALIMEFRQSGGPIWVNVNNHNAGANPAVYQYDIAKQIQALKKPEESNNKRYKDWQATKKYHWEFVTKNSAIFSAARKVESSSVNANDPSVKATSYFANLPRLSF